MKLEHIVITISDKKELNNFYRDILGFKLKKQFELHDELSKKIFGIPFVVDVNIMEYKNITLEIFIHSEMGELQYNHICLSIKNREEVYKKAVANGYESVRMKRDNNDLIFIKDKSKNILELKSIFMS